MRIAIARNHAAPPEVLGSLYGRGDDPIPEALASNPSTPRWLLSSIHSDAVSSDEDDDLAELADNPSAEGIADEEDL